MLNYGIVQKPNFYLMAKPILSTEATGGAMLTQQVKM